MNCENCKHFYEDQSEYHWCHMCQMEESCYSPIEKDGEQGMNEDTKSMGISFDEVKQMFRDSIDESANINDLLQSVANKIYLKGFHDGILGIMNGGS